MAQSQTVQWILQTSQPLPPRRGFRQLLAPPALPLPLFVVSHLPTDGAPYPHCIDMVRHPYAGHRTKGEVWTKEPVHGFPVGATTEQLLWRRGVRPSGGRFPWSPGPRQAETPPIWHGAASLGPSALPGLSFVRTRRSMRCEIEAGK